MFQIFDYQHGNILVVVLATLIIACFQSSKCNKWIDEYNRENSKDDVRKYKLLPHAPIPELIFCIVLVIIALLIPVSR